VAVIPLVSAELSLLNSRHTFEKNGMNRSLDFSVSLQQGERGRRPKRLVTMKEVQSKKFYEEDETTRFT